MGIYLGIDGGGSKTAFAVGDGVSLLGRATSGGSNIIKVGELEAQASLANGIEEVCKVSKVAPSQITCVCIGLAGAGGPEISAIVRRMLAQLVSGEIKVFGDMVIAHQAAFGSGAGVIVIAGTGSIAYGRNSAELTARAGGWGFAISDEGSGHWMGKTAVAASLRAHDQARDFTLLNNILRAWDMPSNEKLVIAANAVPPPDFATLFPIVLGAAESGDALAVEILHRAGSELAILAKIVGDRIFPGAAVPVAMAGGVFRNSSTVRLAFHNELRDRLMKVIIHETVIDPVLGALELAQSDSAKT